MGFHKSFVSGADTSDATAEQWDIKTGKDAYIVAGKVTGTGYFPAMMKFDGASYYELGSYTSSGNKVTCVGRFRTGSFTTQDRWIVEFIGASAAHRRLGAIVGRSDSATTDERNKLVLLGNSNAGTNAYRIVSDVTVADNLWHLFFFEYDGDVGTIVFKIDGLDADMASASSRVLGAATLNSGAASLCRVGLNYPTVAGRYWDGEIGFIGQRDVGGLDYTDFMQADGSPKNVESTLNTVWGGGAPAFWHESGKMDENKGSDGAMTKTGTITLAAASSWS